MPEPDRLNTSGAYREALKTLDEDLRFRDGDFTPHDRKIVAEIYEDMVARGSYQFREAMPISMRTV